MALRLRARLATRLTTRLTTRIRLAASTLFDDHDLGFWSLVEHRMAPVQYLTFRMFR